MCTNKYAKTSQNNHKVKKLYKSKRKNMKKTDRRGDKGLLSHVHAA